METPNLELFSPGFFEHIQHIQQKSSHKNKKMQNILP